MTEILTLCFLATLTTFFIWQYYYKKYCVDAYRQKIFSIRDDLFDFAANGGISFEHPAYGMARTYLNGTIRFTERLSFVQMIISGMILGPHRSHFEEDMNRRLKGLSAQQKETIMVALDCAANQTVLYLVKKNVFFLACIYLLKCGHFIRGRVKPAELKDKLAEQYKSTYSDAVYDEGSGYLKAA